MKTTILACILIIFFCSISIAQNQVNISIQDDIDIGIGKKQKSLFIVHGLNIKKHQIDFNTGLSPASYGIFLKGIYLNEDGRSILSFTASSSNVDRKPYKVDNSGTVALEFGSCLYNYSDNSYRAFPFITLGVGYDQLWSDSKQKELDILELSLNFGVYFDIYKFGFFLEYKNNYNYFDNFKQDYQGNSFLLGFGIKPFDYF
ncbi:hypothetical protein ACFL7D_02025 [candidate division KSB1 bacterium]